MQLKRGEQIKKHWQQNHPEKFAEVQKWLKDTTQAKLEAAAILAKEGMQGRNAAGV